MDPSLLAIAPPVTPVQGRSATAAGRAAMRHLTTGGRPGTGALRLHRAAGWQIQRLVGRAATDLDAIGVVDAAAAPPSVGTT